MKVRKFTLIELLVVIIIISILVAALGSALVGATESAQIQKMKIELSNIKTGIEQYQVNYSRPPTELKDLLKESSKNSRKLTFLSDDMIPMDVFKKTQEIKILKDISSVTFDEKKNITDYKIDAANSSGWIIYSVGPNGIDESGKAEMKKKGKDDVAIFVTF